MAARRLKLSEVIRDLQRRYGEPAPPDVTDPFEIILYENVAYLVDDERRAQVWMALKRSIGIDAQDILAAPIDRIASVIKHGGMQPDRRAEKLRAAAELVINDFDGDLTSVLTLPVTQKVSRHRRPGRRQDSHADANGARAGP